MRARRALLIVITVMAIASLCRLAMVFSTTPDTNPDTIAYTTVAENIYQHHCVSRSDPASGLCKPNWGGNQPLPGYTAFISLAWLIGGASATAILVLQSLAAAAAIARFAYAILVFTQRDYLALAVGCLLAVSPLQIGFSRAVMTEDLATATTIWVIAELLLSIARARLRILPVGLALLSAIFVRTDAVLLCALAAGVGFYLHGWRDALRRGALLALIIAVPVGAWVVRAVLVGLPPYPGLASSYYNDWPAPAGMVRWGTTWMVTEGQEREYLFPILEAHYSQIVVPPDTYTHSAGREAVESALASLAEHDGAPVPPDVDAKFAALAQERRQEQPLKVLVTNPMRRALAIWASPYYRFDWPIGQFDNHAAAEIVNRVHQGISGALSVVKKYPVEVAERLLINGYRFTVIGGFLLIVALSGRKLFALLRPLILMVAAYAVLRTVFFTAIVVPGVETRYMVETLPGMEAACILGVALYLQRRAARKHDAAAAAAEAKPRMARALGPAKRAESRLRS